MSAQRRFLQICQNVKQLFFAFKSEVCFEALWKYKALGVLSTPYHLSKSGIWKAKDVSVSGRWLLLIIFPELPPSPLPPSHGWRWGVYSTMPGAEGSLREKRRPAKSLACLWGAGWLPPSPPPLTEEREKWSWVSVWVVLVWNYDRFFQLRRHLTEFPVWQIAPY